MVYRDFFRSTFERVSFALSDLTLARKLLLSYFLLLVVPVMVGTVALLRNIRAGLETEVRVTNQREVDAAAAVVARNAEVLKNASQTVIGTARLASMLAADGPFTTEELLDFRWNALNNIDNVKYINIDIHSLRVYHPNRSLPELYPTLYHEDVVSSEIWYPDVIDAAGRLHWRLDIPEVTGDGHFDDAESVVALYRQWRAHGRHLGVIEVSMRSRAFFGPTFAGPDTSGALVYVLRNGELYHRPLPAGESEYGIDAGLLAEYLDDTATGQPQTHIVRIGSAELALSGAYVREIDAWLFRAQSLTAHYRGLHGAIVMVLAGATVMILMLSVATYYITNALTGRLALVMTAINQMHAGAVLPELAVYGNDEIGVLARHIRTMMERMNELIFTLVRKETAAKEAEISALHAQIDGHFIHNVLETVKMMAVVEDQFAVSDALTALGRLMRYSMSRGRRYVWIQEEIAYVSTYLKLLNIRFDGKMLLSVDCPPDLEEQELPKMTLQPIVENAVRHGIEPIGGGTVTITVRRDNSDVVIEISDTGQGLSPERLDGVRARLDTPAVDTVDSVGAVHTGAADSGGMGIGLANVQERIRLHFGVEYGLELYSTPGSGTTVRLRVPLFGRHGSGAS